MPLHLLKPHHYTFMPLSLLKTYRYTITPLRPLQPNHYTITPLRPLLPYHYIISPLCLLKPYRYTVITTVESPLAYTITPNSIYAGKSDIRSTGIVTITILSEPHHHYQLLLYHGHHLPIITAV